MKRLNIDDVMINTSLCCAFDVELCFDEPLEELPDITGVEAVSVFTDDKIIIYTDNIQDIGRLKEVMNHELFGHFVLRRTHTVSELESLCLRVAGYNAHTFLFKQVQNAYPGATAAMLGEEFIASTMERAHRIDSEPYSQGWIYNYMMGLRKTAARRVSYDERNREVAYCRVR